MKRNEPFFEAHAALTMFEALAIALIEKDVLTKDEVQLVLDDAAQAHRNQAELAGDAQFHLSVASLIERIAIGANSVGTTRKRLEPNPTRGKLKTDSN